MEALYDMQVLGWNRTRDYFIAYLISTNITKQDGSPFRPSEILAAQYPEPDVMITLNPDEGAVYEGTMPSGGLDNASEF